MFLILFLFLISTSQIYTAIVNEIKDLFPNYTHPLYSGYLNTDMPLKDLFFILAESQNSPSTDPLILWLNGGPGCSSLTGFLDEIGPFTSDLYSGNFTYNPYSWNMNASLLFIEQPAGVGFSITNDVNYTWDDLKSSNGLKTALDDFFTAFPNYLNNKFYIAGESYSGIYIPYTASAILNDTQSKIKLRGILVGNGLTLQSVDVENSMVEFTFWRGLISIELYEKYLRICPHISDDNSKNDKVTHECNLIRKTIKNHLNGLDIYGIYHPCRKENISNLYKESYYTSYKYTFINQLKEQYKTKLKLEPEEGIWPSSCGEDTTKFNFLNNKTIQQKLNVSKKWSECVRINYPWGESFWFYDSYMKNLTNFTTWFFSGTDDMAVDTLGSLRWIEKLNLDIKNEWRQWKLDDGQVAGMIQDYDYGFSFVTVKGAGHMVPQDKRKQAKVMLDSFLSRDS